jgi:hypothetical protein
MLSKLSRIVDNRLLVLPKDEKLNIVSIVINSALKKGILRSFLEISNTIIAADGGANIIFDSFENESENLRI